ncbi:ATP-binding cassette domain-containing protein [Amycolatopsis saalfeldensis]|uniref:ABC transporter n=1 Tax=Amycolatopsis saalfeldensis TaxID=394193 RepID=A0A1H8UQI6_9PSEU|nr:ATP-binding cassette domain-containing protein [Amycolatopsis saalfeldensis]SEP05411.1 ABC transporter [Amycolatopsis saalfeldensis]
MYAESGPPFEKVAAAKPELILAGDEYDLAKDFPTLGYLNGTGKDSWQQMAQRAGDVLGRRSESDHLGEPSVELRDVRFRYSDSLFLEGVSLKVPAGSTTALVGPSGAGKTTVTKLVAVPRRGRRVGC